LTIRKQNSYRVLAGTVTLLALGLLFYSQTDAFAWDEGFHLLTAQLITRGERPYLDFNFSQTPLNAYWNAFWMLVFGQTWRTAHAVAAVMTTLAVMLIADCVFTRFPVPRWRFPLAMMAALAVGLNVLIVQYGTIGQAYGLALFLIVAAFRITLNAVDAKSVTTAFFAGLLSSAAAGATLLTAPVCPVLGIWILAQNRAGNRWAKAAAFLAAAVIPFIPVAVLFAKGPEQTYFNIIQYNLLFRQVEWAGAIAHDLGVMGSWLNSVQAFSIGLLALAGLLFIRFRSDWTKAQRAEFYLCGWLALALGVHISSAHPTFQRYYLFSLPFLVILATAGMYTLVNRLYIPDRPVWPIIALTLIFSLELAKALWNKHDNINWYDLQNVAAKADQVTPKNALILGDEYVYFLTKRPPPSGMELADSHKLEFPPDRARRLHLVSEAEELKQLKAGRFATAADCDKGHKIGEDDFKKMYRQKYEDESCAVYWDLIR
jgi:4-amino-4-deoxy-L-arabinose transferase-like glycosyltransferase